MEDKNFLALDLEMNSFEGSDKPGKIIQVGVAIGTLNAFRFNLTNPLNKLTYVEKSWYVYPGEKIFPRITELTGITDDDVQNHSTPLEIVHHELQVLMSKYSCYVNPVVWGNGDSELLKTEIRDAIGCCHIFGHRDIDVKTLHSFQLISNNKKTNSSLRTALGTHKMRFDGVPHRAMDDARNTLNLFFTMLNKQMLVNDIVDQVAKLK